MKTFLARLLVKEKVTDVSGLIPHHLNNPQGTFLFYSSFRYIFGIICMTVEVLPRYARINLLKMTKKQVIESFQAEGYQLVSVNEVLNNKENGYGYLLINHD